MVPFYQTTQCNTQKEHSVVAAEVVIEPVPLVCSASWGEGSNYNLGPYSKGALPVAVILQSCL